MNDGRERRAFRRRTLGRRLTVFRRRYILSSSARLSVLVVAGLNRRTKN